MSPNSPISIQGVEAPETAKKGLYVSEFGFDEVLGYVSNNRLNKPPICDVSGGSDVNDIAVDGKGNLIVPDGGSRTIKVYKGLGMCGAELGSVSDPYGVPDDATSADAATGTIVVANLIDTSGPGSISLCTLKVGCTTNLTNPNMYVAVGVAQANNGDCWASSSKTSSGGAALIYFKGCAGSGQLATRYQNQNFGGLDIDSEGNLLAIDESNGLYVYKGCSPRCSRVGGPFALKQTSFYGHVNQDSTSFAAGNLSSTAVDLYAYSPTNVQYEYSFNNGLNSDYTVEGAAYNPRSSH